MARSARLVEPASKLATTRLFSTTSLGPALGVEEASEDELDAAMDWLLARQGDIEKRLARRYLKPGDVVLYDLTSTYVEGEHCELAKRGYSRDGRPGKAQIEFGLLTNAEGRGHGRARRGGRAGRAEAKGARFRRVSD